MLLASKWFPDFPMESSTVCCLKSFAEAKLGVSNNVNVLGPGSNPSILGSMFSIHSFKLVLDHTREAEKLDRSAEFTELT